MSEIPNQKQVLVDLLERVEKLEARLPDARQMKEHEHIYDKCDWYCECGHRAFSNKPSPAPERCDCGQENRLWHDCGDKLSAEKFPIDCQCGENWHAMTASCKFSDTIEAKIREMASRYSDKCSEGSHSAGYVVMYTELRELMDLARGTK